MKSAETVRPVDAPPETATHRRGWLGRVAFPLARIEGRRFLGHPLFATGLVMALVGLALYLASLAHGRSPVLKPTDAQWINSAWYFAFGIMVFTLFTMMGSVVLALSERRDGTKELFDSLPAPGVVRTGAHLLAVLWPTAVAVTLVSVVAASGGLWGNMQAKDLVWLAQAVVTVGLLGTLGVLLARLVPSLLVGPVAAFGAFVLYGSTNEPERALGSLAPWAGIDAVAPAAWHLIYVAGLIVVVCSAAFLREGLRKGPVLAGALGLVIVVASAFLYWPISCPRGAPCLFG